MAEDRRRKLGAAGERAAREHLEAAGFEVLAQNFRTRHGELDIVAADSRSLVVCEVKTRVGRRVEDAYGPFLSVGHDKQRRVRRMAREWLRSRPPRPRPPNLRFDAIGVTVAPDGRVLALEHLESAF